MLTDEAMSDEFRVEYTITRRRHGEDDFTEIGFGSSGAWESIEQAGYMAECAILSGEYERVSETKP